MNKYVKGILFYVLMLVCVCSLMIYSETITLKTELIKAVVFIVSATGLYLLVHNCTYKEMMDMTGTTWLSDKLSWMFDDDDEYDD